ncbi:MAG TPA: DUF2911 domain-containing protein [Gemmatimonadales bacterium]|nr:DUF2911 domain-containing protein [Gemmatimonadales bacterium]
MRRARVTALSAILAGIGAVPAHAQFNCWFRGNPAQIAQRPSPPDSAEVRLGGATVKVCYGAPSANGRKIMGGLVPLGQPWRLGANEATTINVPFAAEIAGVRMEPGTYSLYAIPGESEWEIVVNRALQRWGIPINDEIRAQDVGSGRVPVETLPAPVDQLSLTFGSTTESATELVIEWERTRVRVPIRRLGA